MLKSPTGLPIFLRHCIHCVPGSQPQSASCVYPDQAPVSCLVLDTADPQASFPAQSRPVPLVQPKVVTDEAGYLPGDQVAIHDALKWKIMGIYHYATFT